MHLKPEALLKALPVFFACCVLATTLPACKTKKDKLEECKRKCEKKLKLRAAKNLCKAICENKYGEKKSKGQLEKDCNKGNGEACFKMAGKNIKSDPSKAGKYLKKGCEAGHAKSCFYLGRAHDEGKGVAKSREESTKYFEKACQGGYHKACANVGLRIIKTDPARAFKLLEKACAADSKYGCGLMGVMYRDGRGTTADKVKAKQYFKKACSMGLDMGCKQAAKLP